jgi:hypothetical protein
MKLKYYTWIFAVSLLRCSAPSNEGKARKKGGTAQNTTILVFLLLREKIAILLKQDQKLRPIACPLKATGWKLSGITDIMQLREWLIQVKYIEC